MDWLGFRELEAECEVCAALTANALPGMSYDHLGASSGFPAGAVTQLFIEAFI